MHCSDIPARIAILLIFLGVQGSMIYFFFIPVFSDELIAFAIIVVFWTIFSFLWIWCYLVTCWFDAGSLESALIKRGFLVDGVLTNLPPEIDILPRCNKCGLPKPARCHHCGECNKCYFRFDHHCPVVGNCIALYNMKAFMLFLVYTCVLLILISAAFLVEILISDKSLQIIYCLGIGMCIFIALLLFCFAYQYFPEVCVHNRTTLERIAGNDPSTFDKGNSSENAKQVFGNSRWAWLVPTRPECDGFTWDTFSISRNLISE